ncbi:hypothetical protein ACQKDS_11165 [Serratia sp. NPDC078593]|uniref:hypothetical protein n=1 Tax=unclassified Serratia (in: enterobacteria) TaxID=2647522 RepID=UPI0037CFD708
MFIIRSIIAATFALSVFMPTTSYAWWVTTIESVESSMDGGEEMVTIRASYAFGPYEDYDHASCNFGKYYPCRFGLYLAQNCRGGHGRGKCKYINLNRFGKYHYHGSDQWLTIMQGLIDVLGHSGTVTYKNKLSSGLHPPDLCLTLGFYYSDYDTFHTVPGGRGCTDAPPINLTCSLNAPTDIDLGVAPQSAYGVFSGRSMGQVSCNQAATLSVTLLAPTKLDEKPIAFKINNQTVKPGEDTLLRVEKPLDLLLDATVVGRFDTPGQYQSKAVLVYTFQ